MNGGVLIEGSINPVVHDGHCEYFTGDCVQIGKGTAQTVGGVVRSIYPANAGTGNSVVHLGNNGSGQLMNTLAEDIDMGVSPPTYTLQDDQHLVNLPTGSTAWPHVSYYSPGGLASADGQAFTLLGHVNNNISGSSGNPDNTGTCTLSATIPPSCTYTFNTATPWSSAPVCTASDQTNAAALKVLATTTSLTITGGSGATGSDKVGYQCQGNPN